MWDSWTTWFLRFGLPVQTGMVMSARATAYAAPGRARDDVASSAAAHMPLQEWSLSTRVVLCWQARLVVSLSTEASSRARHLLAMMVERGLGAGQKIWTTGVAAAMKPCPTLPAPTQMGTKVGITDGLVLVGDVLALLSPSAGRSMQRTHI